jgi:hypothetical protein
VTPGVRFSREQKSNLVFVDRGGGHQGWVKVAKGVWMFSCHSRSEWTAENLREIAEKMEQLEVAD